MNKITKLASGILGNEKSWAIEDSGFLFLTDTPLGSPSVSEEIPITLRHHYEDKAKLASGILGNEKSRAIEDSGFLFLTDTPFGITER